MAEKRCRHSSPRVLTGTIEKLPRAWCRYCGALGTWQWNKGRGYSWGWERPAPFKRGSSGR